VQIEREIYARRHAIAGRSEKSEAPLSAEVSPPAVAIDLTHPTQPMEKEREAAAIERAEADLYPVLQTFLLERESVVTKRIREQTSSNRRGR
jgi:hypothetical protein